MAHKRTVLKPTETRSTEMLVDRMLRTEGDEQEQIIYALQERGDSAVFRAARDLCMSAAPHQRELGVWLLSQNGVAEKTMREQAVPVLLAVMDTETDPAVLAGLGTAFGHLRVAAAVEPLARLKTHPDGDVRFGVVMGLLTQEDSLAIDTLIELSNDQNVRVRGWATFGLGTQIDIDNPRIRAALLDRASDPDDNTRAEALVGLAVRRDARLLEPLLRELTANSVGSLAVEAAMEIGDPSLYAPLVELQSWWAVDPTLLQQAVDSCQPKSQ